MRRRRISPARTAHANAHARTSAHAPTSAHATGATTRATLAALICAALAALLLTASPAAAAPAATAPAIAPEAAQAPYLVVGGTTLYSAQGRCPVAANARRGSDSYAIMAGSCGPVGTQWFANAALTVPVGTTTNSTYPVPRSSLMHYNGQGSSPAAFFNGRQNTPVAGVQPPMVGSSICHWSPTGGLRCGTVTGINQTVALPQGTLRGLIRSNVCSLPGDLGMPAFAGNRLIGFVVGGSGSCASGGATFYQPLGPILSAYGLTVVF
jgi:streptogrisin B